MHLRRLFQEKGVMKEGLLKRENLCSFFRFFFQNFEWKNLTLFANERLKKRMKKHDIVDQNWFLCRCIWF